MVEKPGPEAQVREIRRRTRHRYSAEEKIRIVLEGLKGEESIAELCRREGISPNLYYGWSKEFLEAGKKRLLGDTKREASSGEVVSLRQENQQLKQLVADLSLRNQVLKKSISGLGEDVTEVLDEAIAVTGVEKIAIRHRPRLLSDNGPCFISQELREYLAERSMRHTRGRPYHPMTQGKIERYHRTLKNVVLLNNYWVPGELEREIARFVRHYNQERVHESLGNLTPADVYLGRVREIRTARERLKEQTMKRRQRINRGLPITPEERILPALYRETVS